MSVRITHTDKAPAAIGPYSQGIIAGGFLFTAGQIALDPATGQIVAPFWRARARVGARWSRRRSISRTWRTSPA